MSPWEESSEWPKTCSRWFVRRVATISGLSRPGQPHSGVRREPPWRHTGQAKCRAPALLPRWRAPPRDHPTHSAPGPAPGRDRRPHRTRRRPRARTHSAALPHPHCLTRTASLAFLSPPEAPRTNAPHPARADQSAFVVESSARRGEWMSLTDDHSRIEVRNEVVGNRIGNHIDPLDNCQTIPHFTHDDGNRRL
jgi:hypothetical protein